MPRLIQAKPLLPVPQLVSVHRSVSISFINLHFRLRLALLRREFADLVAPIAVQFPLRSGAFSCW